MSLNHRPGGRATSRRLLQIVIVMLSLVPILAGGAGALAGPAFVGVDLGPIGRGTDLDSHFRYLSGILLGVGLAFLATVPWIERATLAFRLLSALVVLGGLARLLALLEAGPPSLPHLIGLALELLVVPLLALWQTQVARATRDQIYRGDQERSAAPLP